MKTVQLGNFLPFRKFFRYYIKLHRISLTVTHRHDDLCDQLQRVVLGQLKYSFVVINIPPRWGKTILCQALVVWVLAQFPDAHNIYCSYSAVLAQKSVFHIREVVSSEWYQDLYPHTKLGDVQQASHFMTTSAGVVYGAGTEGAITGFGAGLKRTVCGGVIVLDDPAKPNEAQSQVESAKLRFWLENTLKSRRNSPRTPIIVCAQRLALDDLCGYVLDSYKEDVLHIKVPAMQDGESIMPDTVDTASLLTTKAIDAYTFYSQYQQEPIIEGGNVIKVNKLLRHSGELVEWDEKIITSDTAQKKGQANDWWVLQCWARKSGHAYLLDQARGHWDMPEFIKVAAQFFKKHCQQQEYFPVSRFLMEEAASGPGVIQSLNVIGIPVVGIVRMKDKAQRVQDVLQYVETGMVHVPRDEDAEWMPDFRAELAGFTKEDTHAHDDQVDCFADGITNLLGGGLSILDVLGGRFG